MVRLVGEGVEPNIYPLREALRIVEELGVDLVEIQPDANPPVCKAMDYKKFVFDQKKRLKDQKAKATKVVIKEIRLGLKLMSTISNSRLTMQSVSFKKARK